MEKTAVLSCRVTEDQQREIDQNAGECGMTRNEYITARLFVDQDPEPRIVSSFDKDLITVVTTNFMMLQAIAQETISEGQLTKARLAADRLLIEKGYKKLVNEVQFSSNKSSNSD